MENTGARARLQLPVSMPLSAGEWFHGLKGSLSKALQVKFQCP